MSDFPSAAYDRWKTTEPSYPDDRAIAYAAEEAKEEAYAIFEQDVTDFANKYGWPAAVRAVSRAMDQQKVFWK